MRRVLLIDDDEISNFINENIIRFALPDADVTVCISATRALNVLNEDIEKDMQQGPDIILLDIRMPVMDGFGFLEEFSKLPVYYTGNVKIAMLTSSLEEGDAARAMAYENVVEFINKPLTEEKVAELLDLLQPGVK